MTLLDRFRTQSRDKSTDSAARLAFVASLPVAERAAIAAVAREDEDPRVRRAAVAKLMSPSALAAIAREDADAEVRSDAAGMLRDLALEAFEDAGEPESLEAVDAISDPRILSQVARTCTHDIVGLRALARIEDPHLLGAVARHAVVETVRARAFETLRQERQSAEILAVALHSDFKDTAVAAVDTLEARADLDQVIARGRNKGAVKRARTLVRDADEQSTRDAAEARAAELITTSVAIIEPAADVATPPHGDPLAEAEMVPAEEQAAAEVRQRAEDEAAVARAAADAQAEAEAREAEVREAERTQAKLAALVEQAVAVGAETDFGKARKAFNAIRREWRPLADSVDVAPDVLARYTHLDEQMTAREEEARTAEAKARVDALGRFNQLFARVEPLPEKADLTLKAGERALRDLRHASAAIPPLPTKQDFEDVSRRLKAALTALSPKVQELREADDWRRFANAAVQEQLCAKMEALKTVEDPEKIAQEVRQLQEQWRAAAEVPRAQADALWRRFKAAHDEVWPRCEAHFAAQAQARGENLAKKVALCEQAEALVESTNWIQTADAIKALQAEWKTVGPVSRGREKAIWDRFREACDRFFTRRHEDLASRKAGWAENLAKKDALCARAEALATSTDWDTAAAELKKLQAEWKTIGPVKKSKSDAIWQRFRAACDAFFARYAQRHETARAERVVAREAICAELEALAGAEEMPADLNPTVRALRSRWQQEIAARGVDPDRARALDQRFTTASTAVLAKWSAAFAGSEFDPEANRKRMEAFVKKIEELAASVTGTKAVDESLSPTSRLAAMLKDALAANTIGGKADDDSKLRAAAEDLRQAQAAWSRLGPVPDEARRPLADRYQKAVRSISERTSKLSSGPSGPSRGPMPGGGRPDRDRPRDRGPMRDQRPPRQ